MFKAYGLFAVPQNTSNVDKAPYKFNRLDKSLCANDIKTIITSFGSNILFMVDLVEVKSVEQLFVDLTPSIGIYPVIFDAQCWAGLCGCNRHM